MKAQIIKSKDKIESTRRKLATEYLDLEKRRGQDVRYVMPSVALPFPKLSEVIYSSKHRESFYGTYYYLETRNGHVKELVPAAEYYKLAFRGIADKQYSLQLSIKRVEDLKRQIQHHHIASREVISKTGQPSFNIDEQVYQLKSELGNIFFVVRSIMDSVSTLLHFLYGPQFISVQ